MPLPATVRPIERPLVREQVYARLRDWIVRGVLRPTEQMRDVDLARRLGVSRTPVREALRRLEDEGFVQTAANRWTRVAPASVADARQFYPIIWSLEALAMRTAGDRLRPSDLDEMHRANERLRHALREKNPAEASRADRDFHFVFIRRSENPELINILQGLKVKLRRIEFAYFNGSVVAARSVAEHEIILRALRDGDLEAAARCVEANWRNSLERINETISEVSGP
jgi:DNA-binding GntR family transcriptional regulator